MTRYVSYVFNDELVGLTTDRYNNQIWCQCTVRKEHKCSECLEEFESGSTMWRPTDNGMNRSRHVCQGCMEEMVASFEHKNPHIWSHRKEGEFSDEQVRDVIKLARFATDYSRFDEQLGADAPRVYMEDGVVKATGFAISYILNVLAVLANKVPKEPEGQIAGVVIDDPSKSLNLAYIRDENWIDEKAFHSLMEIVEKAAEMAREEVEGE